MNPWLILLAFVWLAVTPWPIQGDLHLVTKSQWLAEGGAGMSNFDLFDLGVHALGALGAVMTIPRVLRRPATDDPAAPTG